MKYYNVLKDILTYYSGTITDIEKEYVYKILFIIKDKKDETISNVIIIFINNILRKIWDLSLTNIKTYKTGDNFCFLTRDIKFYFCIDSLSAKSKTDNEYSLITEKDIANMNLNTVGNIVEINYEGSIRTEPLLPIYFKDGKRKIEDLSCNTLGSFSLNNTFISSTNDLLIEEKKNLPIIYIDKLEYNKKNKNTLLLDTDIISIINDYVANYLLEKEKLSLSKDNFILKKSILLSEKGNIKKLIFSYVNNEINNSELKESIYNIIEKIEQNLTKTHAK